MRNGRLLAAIKRAGYRSVLAFCKKNALSQGYIGKFATMTMSPLNRHGRPTRMAQEVADILQTTVEELFPPRFLATCLSRIARTDKELTEGQLGVLLQNPPRTPEDVLLLDEAETQISDTLRLIPPRNERVLRLRYGLGTREEKTLRQVAAQFGLSPERLRQIEQRAIDMLRHPTRRHRMEEAADTLGVGRFYYRRRAPLPVRKAGVGIQPPVPDAPERAPRPPDEVARPIRRPVRFPEGPPAPPVFDPTAVPSDPMQALVWRLSNGDPTRVMDLRSVLPQSPDGMAALVRFVAQGLGYSLSNGFQVRVAPGYYVVPSNTLTDSTPPDIAIVVERFDARTPIPHAI